MTCKVFYIFVISFQSLNSFEGCRKKLKMNLTQSFWHYGSLLHRIYLILWKTHQFESQVPFLLTSLQGQVCVFILWVLPLGNLLPFQISRLLCGGIMSVIDSSCLERDAIVLPREKYRLASCMSNEVLAASVFHVTCCSHTLGNRRVLCQSLEQITCFSFPCGQSLFFQHTPDL